MSVSELARPFPMSLPAIMKHLDVLVGRRLDRPQQDRPHRRLPARRRTRWKRRRDWLNRYERFWSEQLDRLAAFLEEESWPTDRRSQTKPHPQAPAQRPAGKSLQRLDRPEKANALVRARACEPVPAETDARVGGRYRIVMRAPDGEEHDVERDVYREVVPNEKLVFTWAWQSTPERESLVTVELKPDGDGTLLTLTARAILRRSRARPSSVTAGARSFDTL